MKTMTCKDLGGPCEFAHHGSTADEIIRSQFASSRQKPRRHRCAMRDELRSTWRCACVPFAA